MPTGRLVIVPLSGDFTPDAEGKAIRLTFTSTTGDTVSIVMSTEMFRAFFEKARATKDALEQLTRTKALPRI